MCVCGVCVCKACVPRYARGGQRSTLWLRIPGIELWVAGWLLTAFLYYVAGPIYFQNKNKNLFNSLSSVLEKMSKELALEAYVSDTDFCIVWCVAPYTKPLA